jgi:hypothetical protein
LNEESGMNATGCGEILDAATASAIALSDVTAPIRICLAVEQLI